jgi:Asp-tRNA(Asn)/Glu-tRNA(Gln) amidotransferase A subunit family amidase
VIPLAYSFDHVGPITRTVADAAVILQAIAGYDPKDKVSVDHPVDDYVGALNKKLEPLTIGVPRKFFFEDLHPEVASATKHALDVLATLSNEVRDLEFEVPTQRTLQGAESYAYHAENIKRSPELYQPETLRRIKNGASVEPAEVERRLKLLAKFRAEIGKIFEEVDVLVTPTVPIPPPTIAELKHNPDQLRERELILLRNTRPFNVWGLPAISVPCGFTESGVPIGLQIAGPHWREAKVLQLAQAYEQATAWHKRKPSLTL